MKNYAEERRRMKNTEYSRGYYYRHREKVLERQRMKSEENKEALAERRFSVGGLAYGTLSGRRTKRELLIKRLTSICIATGVIKP